MCLCSHRRERAACDVCSAQASRAVVRVPAVAKTAEQHHVALLGQPLRCIIDIRQHMDEGLPHRVRCAGWRAVSRLTWKLVAGTRVGG